MKKAVFIGIIFLLLINLVAATTFKELQTQRVKNAPDGFLRAEAREPTTLELLKYKFSTTKFALSNIGPSYNGGEYVESVSTGLFEEECLVNFGGVWSMTEDYLHSVEIWNCHNLPVPSQYQFPGSCSFVSSSTTVQVPTGSPYSFDWDYKIRIPPSNTENWVAVEMVICDNSYSIIDMKPFQVQPVYVEEELDLRVVNVKPRKQIIAPGELVVVDVTLNNVGRITSTRELIEVGIYEKDYIVSQGYQSVYLEQLSSSCAGEDFVSQYAFDTSANSIDTLTLYAEAPTPSSRFANNQINWDKNGDFYVLAGIYTHCGQPYVNRAGKSGEGISYMAVPITITTSTSLKVWCSPTTSTSCSEKNICSSNEVTYTNEDACIAANAPADNSVWCLSKDKTTCKVDGDGKCSSGEVEFDRDEYNDCKAAIVSEACNLDGTKDPKEQCDGTDFGDVTCKNFRSNRRFTCLQ